MYELKVDSKLQKFLEKMVENVIKDRSVKEGLITIKEKSRADEFIRSDLKADKFYNIWIKKYDPEADIFSEESRITKKGKRIYIIDPVDGSSEFRRMGQYRSPLTTAIMIVEYNNAPIIKAAAIGDIWSEAIYGLNEKGLYKKTSNSNKNYLKIDKAKHNISRLSIAAYAPTFERLNLIYPELFKKTAYFHNNGGHPFALRVTEGGYDIALEIKPVELYEHIGPLMASYGGAWVKQLNGESLSLDINLKQTSITAFNARIGEEIVLLLKPKLFKTKGGEV